MSKSRNRRPPADTVTTEGTVGESPYEMSIDLNVLDHLGINLYSNIAAVLTEVVANAWDADANEVKIEIDPHGNRIKIADDGIGMSIDEINRKYLRVGYQRRKDRTSNGKLTAKRRPIMGRKGLGKLSLFSVADVIEVRSSKDGKTSGFRMSSEGIREAAKQNGQVYRPEPINGRRTKKGTEILLSEIKRKRLGKGVRALRKRLARRFSIIGEKHGFKVTLNGDPVRAEDRGDQQAVQFLWTLGKPDPEQKMCAEAQYLGELPATSDDRGGDWAVGGWIGTARRPSQLNNEDEGNLNSIVVFARGRLFHENILDKINDGRLYTKYLTGQIEAEFLDEDSSPDIATSDRQRMQEDDPRYVWLVRFLKETLAKIEGQWNELRCEHETKNILEEIPVLGEWIGGLPVGHRQSARKMISKLSSLPIEDGEDKRTVYKHGIYAFERMRLKGLESQFVEGTDDVEALLVMLADQDALEASLCRDIVDSRLRAIQHFKDIADEDAKERVLQKHLFKHLWLLDPTWARVNESAEMETRLAKAKVIVSGKDEKEKIGRVDLTYRTYFGRHYIIELKKVSKKMKLVDLLEQGSRYVNQLRDILLERNVHKPDIEVVFVLGRAVEEEKSDPDRLKSILTGISPGSRIVHYDTLIQGAQDAYREYMDKSKELDKIEKIVSQLG